MYLFRIGSIHEFFEISLPSNIKSKNWAQAHVSLSVEGFVCNIDAFFDKADFTTFLRQLTSMNHTLLGVASLEPLDRQFALSIKIDSTGHLHIVGEAWSRAIYRNKLSFEFGLDQSYLPDPIKQLEQIVNVWSDNDD